MLLQAALLINAALVVGRSDWVAVPTSLAAVAVSGGLLGFMLAKTACPDVIAHLTAAIVGLWAVGFQVLTVFPELGASRRDRFAELIERTRVWYRGTTSGNQQDDRILFALVLAFTLWLVSYLAVWTLFRRRWVLVSILLPGFLVLVTMGYSPELGSMPLVVALLLSGMLSALYFAFRRDQVWRRFRIPSPQGISRRVSLVGAVLVIIVVALAWSVPTSSASDVVDDVRDWCRRPLAAIGDWWTDSIPSLADGDQQPAETYASFDDSFELGGGVSLGDEAAATLRGVRGPQYLVGIRYGVYTGHGWETDVADTFNPIGPDGTVYSPQMTFQPEQIVALSDEVTGQTEEIAGTVTLLRPKGELVFTLDAYLRSDLPTSVQLSWLQVENKTYRLPADDLPTELRGLASLLLLTDDYSAGNADTDGAPLPNDEQTAQRIVQERSWLHSRFLATRWEIDSSGAITLFVTGQIAVFDDIEAVFARSPLQPQSEYEVAGLESQAAPEELRSAGSEYPNYIQDRYLTLPDTVTARTLALAASIAGRESNNFDIAQAIEDEVRTTIEYDLNIDAPPSNQDVVDFVLFDSRIGYCEYHASAMAVLLRAAGIPSRVAVGYHQVAFDPATEAYTYRESDAHAWVEAFFPGYGWIPFEPTPSEPLREYGPDEGGESDALILPTSTPTPLPGLTPIPTDGVALESSPTPTPLPPAVNEVTTTDSGGGGWRDWVPWVVVTVLLGLSGLAWFAWTRPYRGLSPAGVLIFQATRLGGWLGVRRDPAMTPDEYATELGRVAPAAKAPIQHVARMYTAERYGAQALNREQRRSGERALRQVRRSLVQSLVRRKSSPDRSSSGER